MENLNGTVAPVRSGRLLIAIRQLPVIEVPKGNSSFHPPDPEIWLRPEETAEQ